MTEMQTELSTPVIRNEKLGVSIFRNLLDVLFWLTVAIYSLGGVWYKGTIRLTYVGDLWNACAIGYVIARVFFGIRFGQTTFGRACLDLLNRSTQGLLEKNRNASAWKAMPLPTLAVGLVVVYTVVLFFYLPLLAFWNGTGLWDMGIFDNTVFNASRTGKMFTYLIFSDGVKPFLFVPGQHLDLGMYVFALIYRWLPRGEVMLLAQSAAFLLAIIPLYRLGRLVLPKEIPSWFPVVLYLLWDPIYRINLWHVHEPAFLIPFALWAFYFIEQRRIGLAVLNMFLMAIWREDAWWTFAGMSLWLGYRARCWKVGIPGFLLGFALFPAHLALFNHVNKPTDRYPFMADTLGNSVKLFVHHPSVLMNAIWDSRKFFVELFLRSGGGIFILGGAAAIPAVPAIFEAGLSPAMSLWYNHYIGNFTAHVMAATLYGWKVLDVLFKRYFPGKNLTRLAAIFSLALCLTQIKTSLPGILTYERSRSGMQTCVDQINSIVPPEAPLIVANPDADSIFSRFTHRPWIMNPYNKADQTLAEWLVSNDRKDLSAGMEGSRPVKPWQIVWEGCGYYVAKRKSD